jgi:hypothetical protein
MNIVAEWAKLPAAVRNALPDNLPAAFGSALAQLAALGLAVDAERSIAALLTAANVEATAARIEGRTVSRSESEWMRRPFFIVGRAAPASFAALRAQRLAQIRNAYPLDEYRIARTDPRDAMTGHYADAELGAAVQAAIDASPSTRPESPPAITARIAPVVLAALNFTPPPRPTPRKDDGRTPEPTPPAPPAPPAAASSGLPAWVLPAAAVAVVGVLLLRRR